MTGDQGQTGPAWLPVICHVGRLVRSPGGPPRQMLKWVETTYAEGYRDEEERRKQGTKSQ